jgi:two-component system, chemotaxis family, chemotaxis protein CheY
MNSKTIMVIEDNDSIRSAVRQIIEDEGYRAQTATNGEDALALLEAAATLPSLILLDMNMPIMDGWGFKAVQGTHAKFRHIPIIVVTADGNAREKALMINASGWIRKPIEVDDLLKAIQKVCG